MRRTRPTLLLAAILSIAVTVPVVSFHLLAWNHFISQQLNQNSSTGIITAVILFVTLWLIFFAFVRFRLAGRELKVLRQAQKTIDDDNVTISLSQIDSQVRRALGRQTPAARYYDESLIRRRFELMKNASQGDLAFAVSNQSGLDAADSDTSYSLARALAWTLPALGFLGTASAMAHAVSGLGATVARTSNYTGLRGFLVQDVIPPLASAFGITLIALASAVVCHLLVTWAHTREQRLLLDADAVTLRALAVHGPAIGTHGHGGLADDSARALTVQIAELNQFLAKSGLDQIERHLQGIRDGLGRDLIIRRS
jgi:hypothetical protein